MAPAASPLADPDPILAVGAAVGEELYRVQIPVVVLAPGELAHIPDGQRLDIGEDGAVTLG